ncbi:hypothetical protein NL676_039260 [Syzygium grande]|nr:hypothetical protein NL676_039260 [Syzygium grande]
MARHTDGQWPRRLDHGQGTPPGARPRARVGATARGMLGQGLDPHGSGVARLRARPVAGHHSATARVVVGHVMGMLL